VRFFVRRGWSSCGRLVMRAKRREWRAADAFLPRVRVLDLPESNAIQSGERARRGNAEGLRDFIEFAP
jgi:hypothetical protein